MFFGESYQKTIFKFNIFSCFVFTPCSTSETTHPCYLRVMICFQGDLSVHVWELDVESLESLGRIEAVFSHGAVLLHRTAGQTRPQGLD